MTENIILVLLGIVVICAGGNFFVDAAVWISEKLRVPKFIIGATVVSLATTLPELTVSLLASISGNHEMAAGNAIGSIVANTGLIFALSASIMPSTSKHSGQMIKSLLLIAALVITALASLGGTLSPISAILFVIWAAFAVLSIIEGKRAEDQAPSLHTPVTAKEIGYNLLKFALGTMGLVFGSSLLVTRGSSLALSLGVSEGVVAATIIAIGTSLPEFTTAITSLIKKQPSLSAGNIIGANIMDIAFIMPLCACVSGGLTVKPQTLLLDIPTAVVFTLIAFTIPAKNKKAARIAGIVLLALYAVYLTLLFTVFAA